MKNCIQLLLVTSLIFGLTACNDDKKNNVNTDYRVDANSELRSSLAHEKTYDNRQVHQVANARFEKEEAYQQRERAHASATVDALRAQQRAIEKPEAVKQAAKEQAAAIQTPLAQQPASAP